MAPLNHPIPFPKSFPKIPAPYKGAAGNFGKSGPDRKRLISGKTGNFGKSGNEGSTLGQRPGRLGHETVLWRFVIGEYRCAAIGMGGKDD